jgi:hypothetical protein
MQGIDKKNNTPVKQPFMFLSRSLLPIPVPSVPFGAFRDDLALEKYRRQPKTTQQSTIPFGLVRYKIAYNELRLASRDGPQYQQVIG